MLTRDAIQRLIPHQGKMCLLDKVIYWDDTIVVCSARSHLDQDNPFRCESRLPALAGIEYAAQAMAVHGGLVLGMAGIQHGYLANVRELALATEWLHDIAHPLTVRAEQLVPGEHELLYRFVITAVDQELMHGRALVVLGSG